MSKKVLKQEIDPKKILAAKKTQTKKKISDKAAEKMSKKLEKRSEINAEKKNVEREKIVQEKEETQRLKLVNKILKHPEIGKKSNYESIEEIRETFFDFAEDSKNVGFDIDDRRLFVSLLYLLPKQKLLNFFIEYHY